MTVIDSMLRSIVYLCIPSTRAVIFELVPEVRLKYFAYSLRKFISH